ncbi:MAG: hypothetical protein IRZ08_14925 [Frankia sp.]|nr:hypothetical protein [Frankia sp.]
MTVTPPGRGGRVFLATTGGAVVILAFASVVLGINGGPDALRPDPPDRRTATPAASTPTYHAPAAPAELPGTPIAATRSYLLRSYAAGSGRTKVEPAAAEVLVGRQYAHVPRRGDDHLLTAELVFPLLPAPPDCVASVELRLTLLATSGRMGPEGPIPLVAYPSALTGLASGQIPATVPRLDLVANRPRGDIVWRGQHWADEVTGATPTPAPGPSPAGGGQAVTATAAWSTEPTAREVAADITELYRSWVAGMPTGDGTPAIPAGTPLVLAVRPALTDVLGSWQHSYAGASSRTPPRLVWTRHTDCL